MRLLLILSLVISYQASNSQDLKKKTVKNKYPSYKEVYYVLKSNPGVKQGAYQKTSKGEFVEKGQFEKNKKSGVWEYYGYQGELEQKYDYDKNQLMYDRSFLSNSEQDNESDYNRIAIFLGGIYTVYENIGYQMRYPTDARRRSNMPMNKSSTNIKLVKICLFCLTERECL